MLSLHIKNYQVFSEKSVRAYEPGFPLCFSGGSILVILPPIRGPDAAVGDWKGTFFLCSSKILTAYFISEHALCL